MKLIKIPFNPSITLFVIVISLLCSHTCGSANSNITFHEEEILHYNDGNISISSHFTPSETSLSPHLPSCDEPSTPKHVALASFSAIVFVLGFLGNLSVILVIQYSQLRKQPGYVLVTSLAAADLGVSVFVTTVKVKHYMQNGNFCSTLAFCVFQNFNDGLFPTASITHLLFICINRFCAITSPYSYHSLVTHTREIMVVLLVWFYCLVWTSAGMFTWDAAPTFAINVLSNGQDRVCYSHNALFYVCAAIIVFIIPVVVAGVMYVIIVFIALEKIQSTPSVKSSTRSSLNQSSQISQQPTKVTKSQQRSSSARGAKTLMLVFTAWVVCWMPHFMLILVNYWDHETLISFQEHYGWLSEFVATIISDVLPCLNSCINPFIYFFTSSIFRHALKDTLLKLQKKPRHRAGSVNFLRVKSFKRQISDSVKMAVIKELVQLIPSHKNF